jgi:hypothetical protein
MPSNDAKLVGGYSVEAFGRLTVAFAFLRSKLSRPKADRVSGVKLEVAILLHPKF